MKNLMRFLMIAILLATVLIACDKDETDPPTVSTTAVTSITGIAATSGGDVTSEGSTPVTARGVCWSTAANPTVADSKTIDGAGLGVFTSNITDLAPGTLYHVRAYATNADGTSYGDDIEFSTSFLIKTISFYADWAGGTQAYEFYYDANKRVTGFDRTWDGGADGVFTYDFTVAGKMKVNKDGAEYAVYDINAQGYITKEDWGGGEYASYEYNADGYLTKYYEYWGGLNRLKYDITITNGNITKITTYNDDGVTVKRIKEFTYTIGDNVNSIHQANAVDSDWKTNGNFYGKASAKLVDFFEYWNMPAADPLVKSKSTLSYTFDAKNRPSVITKTLTDMSTEVWTYTYYE